MARRIIRPLWEAAMKSADGWAKGTYSESYAAIEPWVAYDYVAANLSKQSKNHFVFWQMPHLYAADPEEALAVLESLDTEEDTKAFALLGTVREAPGLSRQQKLDLLDRATQHLRATTDPGERVFRLSGVALRLFDLGKTEEAKKIVDFITPTAKQLSPKTNVAACASAGEAISLFDLPAGMQLICDSRDADNDNYSMPALFHVAYRIARQQPDEAERIAAEAIDFAQRSDRADFQKEYHHDPTEEDLANSITWSEKELIPLCYRLVSVDVARAQRMAAAIHNPYLQAYAVGMIAKALRPRTRRKPANSFRTLTTSWRKPAGILIVVGLNSFGVSAPRPLPPCCCRLSRRSIRPWLANACGRQFPSACIGRPTTSWSLWSRKPMTPRWPRLWHVTIADWPVGYCPAFAKQWFPHRTDWISIGSRGSS